jgi:hypothetical protein
MLSLNTKDFKHWLKGSGSKVCYLRAVSELITPYKGSEVDIILFSLVVTFTRFSVAGLHLSDIDFIACI